MASKYGGYMGRVLKINLTDKSITEYPFSDSERELFIGGKTMANKILYDNLTGNEKPLSEENMLESLTKRDKQSLRVDRDQGHGNGNYAKEGLDLGCKGFLKAPQENEIEGREIYGE